jgi:hypothetical protein
MQWKEKVDKLKKRENKEHPNDMEQRQQSGNNGK